MKNTNKKTKGVILLLILAVVLMTVGFALYSQNLTINGSVTVKGTPWDVRYITDTTDTDYVMTSTGVTATSATLGNTNFAFTVTLEKPGDYYEATFKAKNFGTMDAILKTLTMSSLTAAQQEYLSYTVTYNGTEYDATASNLSTTLSAGAAHTVVVRVEYLQPASASDLPATDTTVTVTGNLYYESAT